MKTASTTKKANETSNQRSEEKGDNMPTNAFTGKEYFGNNADILLEAAASKGFDSIEWATLKQWNKLRRSISAKAKATRITRYERIETVDAVEYQPVSVYVFNRCQLEPIKRVTV